MRKQDESSSCMSLFKPVKALVLVVCKAQAAASESKETPGSLMAILLLKQFELSKVS